MSVLHRRRKKLLKRKQWDNSARAKRESMRKPLPTARMTDRMLTQIRGWW
jgi:hypothetical protein